MEERKIILSPCSMCCNVGHCADKFQYIRTTSDGTKVDLTEAYYNCWLKYNRNIE